MISRTMSRRSPSADGQSRMIVGSLIACILGLLPRIITADTHYVNLYCTNPVSNYTSWATASTNIQLAVDAAVANDTVLVSNGVYNTGGMTQGTNTVTNRVVISKIILLAAVSTNPTDTVIEGAADPLTTNGSAAVRCVKATVAATISGFTLRFGHTQTNDAPDHNRSGGAIYGSWTIVTNCAIVSNAADYNGGGATVCSLKNCIVSYNTASGGGGMYNGGAVNSVFHHNAALGAGGGINTFLTGSSNCLIYSNTALGSGGGVSGLIAGNYKIYDCIVSNNFSGTYGGGVSGEWLVRCQVLNNIGLNGGGVAYQAAYSNCIFRGNIGTNAGGAYGASAAAAPNLYNCLFVANSAQASAAPGGAGPYAFLHNCTVVSNASASGPGGLGANAAATNCIVTDNYRTGSGVSNYSSTVFAYSCTYPLPMGAGDAGGNTASTPGFRNPAAGDYHLTSQSPCVNSGTNEAWLNDATDLDGLVRIRYGRVDMGCYEHIYQGVIFSIR